MLPYISDLPYEEHKETAQHVLLALPGHNSHGNSVSGYDDAIVSSEKTGGFWGDREDGRKQVEFYDHTNFMKNVTIQEQFSKTPTSQTSIGISPSL
jgi:hypothetical protein